MGTSSDIQQHYWLVDTRNIWNPPTTSTSPNPPNTIKENASSALSIVPADERTKAERFHFHRDAKLSLASSLLKRHFITTCFPSTSFSQLPLSRRGDPKHGKPCYIPAPGVEVDFNVSHQAGLVALAGYVRTQPLDVRNTSDSTMTLGVDITNTHERHAQDHRFIARSGFDGWVDMHEDIFSAADLAEMKEVERDEFGYVEPDWEGEQGLDKRRRKFYAYWCLKEAYVKLEGEALLAGWLREVSFRNAGAPEAGKREGVWGETVDEIELWRGGRKEEETRLQLRAWGKEFIVGLAVKGDQARALSADWTMLDLERVVREHAP